jgi:hypothetical protein
MSIPVAVQKSNPNRLILRVGKPIYSAELLQVVQINLSAGWWVVFGRVFIGTAFPAFAIVQLRSQQGQTILDEIAHPFFQGHFYRLQASLAVDPRENSDEIDIAVTCSEEGGVASEASLMAIKVNEIEQR